MSIEPGVYGDQCRELLEQTQAEGAIIIVLRGIHGSGFSVAAEPEIVAHLPGMLEDLAKAIRGAAN